MGEDQLDLLKLMIINPLTGTLSGASAQSQRSNDKVRAVIENLLGSKTAALPEAQDASGLSLAAELQSRIGSIKSAAQGVLQAENSIEVATQVVQEQVETVRELESLAKQAITASDVERKALDTTFQNLLSKLHSQRGSAQFNNRPLLDGSFSITLDDNGEDVFALPDTSPEALFKGKELSLATQDGAKLAEKLTQEAGRFLEATNVRLQNFSEALEFVAANYAAAIYNEAAARSELPAFSDGVNSDAGVFIQQNLQQALQAQTSRVSSSVFNLLSN